MSSSLRTYAFYSRHAGRIVADRECAQLEVARVLPVHQTMGLDSAANIFRAALDALGINHSALDDAALPAMFRVASRAGVVNSGGTICRPMALDAAAAKSFRERFPDAARVGFA